MARPANPTPQWDTDRKVWWVRITLPKPPGWPKGKEAPRESHDLSPKIGSEQFELAKIVAKGVSDAKRRAQADPNAGETCTSYFERLGKFRRELGRRDTHHEAFSWSKWIAPRIGHLPVAKVGRDEVEGVRDALDEAIILHTKTAGKEGIGAKRARDVWTVITTTFKAAQVSKRRDLRVRDDNPCAGVLHSSRVSRLPFLAASTAG